MRANGLRRLAVALCALCLVTSASVLAYEVLSHRVGYFVEMTLPVGTVVNGTQATLPDGRVVTLATALEPHIAKPGEIHWTGDPAVAELHVQRFIAAIALGVPLLAWLVIDAVALGGGWVARGFRRGAA